MGPPTDPSECAECCDSDDKDMWYSCQCCCMEDHCELCWCCRMGRKLICCPCCVTGYFCACLACDCPDYEVVDRVLAWTQKGLGADENVWGEKIESNENPNNGFNRKNGASFLLLDMRKFCCFRFCFRFICLISIIINFVIKFPYSAALSSKEEPFPPMELALPYMSCSRNSRFLSYRNPSNVPEFQRPPEVTRISFVSDLELLDLRLTGGLRLLNDLRGGMGTGMLGAAVMSSSILAESSRSELFE